MQTQYNTHYFVLSTYNLKYNMHIMKTWLYNNQKEDIVRQAKVASTYFLSGHNMVVKTCMHISLAHVFNSCTTL